MFKTTRFLMFGKEKTKKLKMLLSGIDTMVWIRDGISFILIRWANEELMDSTGTSDCISTDHSTLSQDCQWEESLKPQELEPCTSREEFITEMARNGNSTKSQRPLSMLLGKEDLLIFRTPDHPLTSKSGTPTQDGSNFSDTKDIASSARKERS